MTYKTALNHAVGRSIAAGYHTFEEIAQSAEGAFPSDVEQAARRLGVSLRLTRPVAYSPPVYRTDWPEPHPANYEWRFTEESASAVTDLVSGCKGVACLGCPTVFHHLQLRGVNATLIDRNRYVLNSLQTRWPRADIRELDLRFRLPNDLRGKFEAIIADPPWYPHHIITWINRGTELATPRGGYLLVSLFPRLTRPGAQGEIDKIIYMLRRIGTVEFLPLRPLYVTPQFEAESLIASGIPVASCWRQGHWIRIFLQGSSYLKAPFPLEPSWKFFRFGKEILAIRHGLPQGPIRIAPLGKDGILRTTSARDPLRTRIDIWTSRNRIFRASGATNLFSLFDEAQHSFVYSGSHGNGDIGDLLVRDGLAGLRRIVCL